MSNVIGNDMIGSALNQLSQNNDAVNENAAQKFQAMMDAPNLVPPSSQASNDAAVFTQMVASHDAAAKMSVVSSSKSSAETLMKNQ
jgi:type III secretion inner rod protein HrpB2